MKRDNQCARASQHKARQQPIPSGCESDPENCGSAVRRVEAESWRRAVECRAYEYRVSDRHGAAESRDVGAFARGRLTRRYERSLVVVLAGVSARELVARRRAVVTIAIGGHLPRHAEDLAHEGARRRDGQQHNDKDSGGPNHDPLLRLYNAPCPGASRTTRHDRTRVKRHIITGCRNASRHSL
jgi:hypothetical protein